MTAIGPARGGVALDRLKRLLAEYDAAALDLLEAESALFRSLFGSGGVAELRQRIEAYAFDDAAAWLEAAVEQTGLASEDGHPVPSMSMTAAIDDPQAVQQAIDRLHHYLTDCDIAAVDHLEANSELIRARVSREAFVELEQRIQAFDLTRRERCSMPALSPAHPRPISLRSPAPAAPMYSSITPKAISSRHCAMRPAASASMSSTIAWVPNSEPALRALAWQGRFLVVGFAAGKIQAAAQPAAAQRL